MNDSEMIKTASQAEAVEKQAVEPMTGPMAGGGGPMPMDPAMMGGMPPMGGVPPMPPAGGDPAAGGAPPFDPSMLGMPPEAGGGEAPPFDPSMLEAGGEPPAEEPPPEDPLNDPERDMDEDGRADTMVPLNEMKDFTVGIIEATKGKKTQEAAPPGMGGASSAGSAGPETPAGAGPLASIGGAPAAEPAAAMPKLGDIQRQMEEDLR